MLFVNRDVLVCYLLIEMFLYAIHNHFLLLYIV